MQPTINEGQNGDLLLVEFISVSCMWLARYVINICGFLLFYSRMIWNAK